MIMLQMLFFSDVTYIFGAVCRNYQSQNNRVIDRKCLMSTFLSINQNNLNIQKYL